MKLEYEKRIEIALDELRLAKQKLSNQISDYPTPVSGCDAQFNQMLSDRVRLTNAIIALEECPFVATPRTLDPVSSV